MSQEMTKPSTQTAQPLRAEDGRAAVRPRVDVFESASEYLVVADMPGVAKDAIDIRFEDGELRLEAQRMVEAPGAVLAEEYRAADFRRAFAMPEGIDADKISADLANGVLRVHLPKSEAKRPRRIEVRAS